MEQETEQKTEQKEEEIVVPKKGYDLSWLDKLDDLENASPTSISTKSKVISKRSVESHCDKEEDRRSVGNTGPKKQLPEKKEAAKKEVDEAPQAAESPAEEQQAAAGKADSAPKKAPAARKPIRPRFQRPAPIGNKTDAFEIEFKLDPNDDPFKPKANLGSSPPKSAPSEANITSDSVTFR